MITVTYGSESQTSTNLAGKTVADARQMFAGPMKIPASAKAQINSQPASETTRLPDNTTVNFV